MEDADLLRYSRHILLDEFGIEAQEKLRGSSALVIGAGGLGSSALMYLASAGVGKIIIADDDKVDLTNLQRQVVHREEAIGRNKADSARQTLLTINSTLKVEVLNKRVVGTDLDELVATSDIVLDCSDNFSTRHAINRACVRQAIPLVSGAAIRFDGQITAFDFRQVGSACYHCLFPDAAGRNEERCATLGVFAPLVGIIGSLQAAEAIRLLGEVGQSLQGRLMMLDALNMKWHTVKYKRDPDCTVCHTSNTSNHAEFHHALV